MASNTHVLVIPDDHLMRYVGTVSGGRQFFITTPFIPANATSPRQDFVACYLFRSEGDFLEGKIVRVGSNWASIEQKAAEFLNALDQPSLGPIRIFPFAIEFEGVIFGLLRRPPPHDNAVACMPGNYALFRSPFNGRYDT